MKSYQNTVSVFVCFLLVDAADFAEKVNYCLSKKFFQKLYLKVPPAYLIFLILRGRVHAKTLLMQSHFERIAADKC